MLDLDKILSQKEFLKTILLELNIINHLKDTVYNCQDMEAT